MILIILAWKNIWRNKRRSIIIVIATAIGLAAGLFSVGLMTGMYDSMVDSAINREYGHIQIHSKDYKRDELFSQSINNINQVLLKLSNIENIYAFTAHSIIEGMASSATSALGVRIIGINPEMEKKVTAISTSIIEGNYLEKSNSILISKKLAEKLKLKLNSKIVLSFSDSSGNIIYAAFRISGIFNTAATNFDLGNVFIRTNDLKRLLGNALPFHEIIIKVNNSMLIEQVKLNLTKSLPDELLVESWKDLAPELKMTADYTDLINGIFLGLILFALLFGLTNTLLMSVLDRVPDFGVLLAIGMYRTRLFLMIIFESLFLSFTGAVIGVIIGFLLTQYFNFYGINLASVSKGLEAYGIPSMLYPYIRSSTYYMLTVMVVITSIFAALYPAVKAIRLKPVEAIRSIA